MAITLGGNAKKIADAKREADRKREEEEKKKASDSYYKRYIAGGDTLNRMTSASNKYNEMADRATRSAAAKATAANKPEASGQQQTGPVNRTLGTETAETAKKANDKTKPTVTYAGSQGKKSAKDFLKDFSRQKTDPLGRAEKAFGEQNSQARTYRQMEQDAAKLRAQGKALDADANDPNRPAVKVKKTAADAARDIAEGKAPNTQARKQDSAGGYRNLTDEEAAARVADNRQREEDIRRGLAGAQKDKGWAMDELLMNASGGSHDGRFVSLEEQRRARLEIYQLMEGDNANDSLTDDQKARIGAQMAYNLKNKMTDDQRQAQLGRAFDARVWNPAQEREADYVNKYGDPVQTVQAAKEGVRAYYRAGIDTNKGDLRQIYQTNPLFAARLYAGLHAEYEQQIANEQAMQADMERHPEAFTKTEKDMVHDRLLAMQTEMANLEDLTNEWKPDYAEKSLRMEGVNDPTYRMINGEDPDAVYDDEDTMAAWKKERAEEIEKRVDALRKEMDGLDPLDPQRDVLQSEINTLRENSAMIYMESEVPTLDNLIYSRYMDAGDRQTYNYIYRTQGRDAANEYLERTKTKWYVGYSDDELKKLDDWIHESGWNMALANAQTAITAPGEAIAGLLYVMDTAQGKLVSAYDPRFQMTRESSLVRQRTGEALANLKDTSFVGIKEGSEAEKALNDARRWVLTKGYDLLSSGIDQYGSAWLMAVPGVGKVLATAALAGKAGTAAIVETLEDGGFSRYAAVKGTVDALCEFGTEKIGMERLVQAATAGKLGKSYLGELAKSVLAEALEEVPGELVDREMDAWYNGEHSERNAQIDALVQKGMSREQAMAAVDNEFARQVMTQAVMAGLSAGVAQGAGYVIGNVSGKWQTNRAYRSAVREAGQIEARYQQDYGAETVEALRTVANDEAGDAERMAALTQAANKVLEGKRGPINPEIAEEILDNDHPKGMKLDELNDWRETLRRTAQAAATIRDANVARQERQAAESRKKPGPLMRILLEEQKNRERAEMERLNKEESRKAGETGKTEGKTPEPRRDIQAEKDAAARLNEEETRPAAAAAETEETAPTPRTTPAERRAEVERLNQEETRTAAATETSEETAPTPRTTPAERRAEAEQLNEQETRQEPVTQADVMEAIQEESEENDRRTVFAAPATVDGGETQVTGIVTTQHDEKNGAQVEVTDAEGNKKTVKLGDVRFTSAWQLGAYDIATSFRDADAARAFLAVAEHESMPLDSLRRDFARYYQYGRNQNESMLNVAGKAISDASARAAYEAGARSLTSEGERIGVDKSVGKSVRTYVENLLKNKPWAMAEDFAHYGGASLDASVNVRRLSATQTVQLYVLDQMGKKYGIHFNLGSNMPANVAGMYAGGNMVMLNIGSADSNLTRAAGHEVFHLLENWNATAANVLRDQLFGALEETGWDLDARVAEKQEDYKKRANQELTREEAMEELAADSLFDLFTREEQLNELFNKADSEGKGVLAKAAEFVKRVVNELRQMMQRAARLNPEVSAVLDADQEKMNQVYSTADMILNAYATAQQAEAENQAETQEQYQLTDKSGNADVFDEKTLEENRKYVANARPLISLNGNPFANSKGHLNTDMIQYFDDIGNSADSPVFGKVALEKEGVKHFVSQYPTPRKLGLLRAVKTVIEQGKVIYTENDHKGKTIDAAVIAAQVEWNGDPYYMGVIIAQNQNTKKNGYYFHDAVFVEAFDAGKIKTPGKLLSSGAANTTAPSLTKRIRILLQELARYNAKFGGNEFSDPEYLRAVENNDKETMARMVDEAARAAGYTIRAYHGTGNTFTEFDKKRIGENYRQSEGGGFFFTSKAKTAQRYAELAGGESARVIDAYLRITNPYEVTTPSMVNPDDYYDDHSDDLLSEMRNGDYDGIIIKGTGDYEGKNLYVAIDPKQIKSAELVTHDNDGKVIPLSERFKTDNKDIRYSLTDIEDHDSETERLIRENNDLGEALQAANTLIDIMRKRPDGLPAAPSAASIDRLARKIKDETGTKVSLKNLRENLDKTFTVMLNAERSGDVEMAYEMLGDIAADAVNQADVIYDPATAMGYDGDEVRSWLTSLIQGIHESDWGTLSEIVGTSNANEIRKWIKDKTGVWMRSTAKLGENAETGATEWQGSRDHRERRNAHGGIDGDYETFARNFPGIVDPDVNDTEDMIAQVLDALDRLKPQVVNRYESADYNEGHPEGVETAKARITADLFQAYLEDDSFTRAMTGAEATRLSKENRRIIQGMDALKEQLRETEQKVNKAMDKLIGAEKRQARTVEMLKNARKEQERIAQSWREKVADQAHRRAENEEYNKLKNHVVKIKNRLQRMAMDPSNTSRGFIPRELNDVVDRLLRAVDYDGTFIPEGATAPALDAAGRAKMDADLVGQLLEAYQTARTTPENGSYILFDEDLPEVIARLRDSLKTKADGMAAQRGIKGSKDYRLTKAERLTMQEMTDLERIMRGMEAMINNANRALTDAKGRRIEEIGEAALEQVDRYVETHGEKKTGTRITEWLNAGLKNGMMKPVTYFDMMRDTEFNRLFYEGDRSLRNAEGTQVRLMQGAEEKLNELLDKYHMRESFNRSGAETQKKRREKAVEITLKTGEKLRITDQEAMSIYATYKREKDGVTNHLLTGGIMLADRDRNTTNKPMVLFLEDINAIIDTLTDEQKAFVDEAVGYLSTEVAEWGNEITRQLYGVDKFTEKYYFPFEVVKSTVEAKVAEAQDQRIKVGSQTKALTVGANNALNIRGFTEVWCQHVEKMADYNAFVLPIEDMTRLLNYQHIIRNDDGDIIGRGRNIKTEMEAAYGKESVQYLVRFLSTLNGNAAHEHGNSWLNSFTSKAKAAAVGGNLSVVLQQAGAGVRAMAEINPGHVLKGISKVNPLRVNQTWAELQKYAWIAVEKDWGYLDTQQTGNLASRNRTTLMSRINDASGAAAGYMDKLNWTQIWEAVKSEQAAAHKDMDPKSEAFLQLCGQRFTEVIDKTQVIDSVFQRSAWAMEKGRMANFMAFMNEPIAQYNMLLRGAMRMQEAARMPKGEARTKAMQEGAVMLTRNSMAIVVSVMLTSALAALVRAARSKDDKKYEEYIDEDGNRKKRIVGRKTYWDKVAEQWWPGVLDSLTSLGGVYADIAKGIFTGEEISNDMSMTWVTSAGYLVRNLIKLAQGGTADPERTAYYGMQVVSNLTGVPLSNVYRDVYSFARTVWEEFVTAGTTEGDAWDIRLPMEQRLAAAQNSYVYNKAAKTGEAANRKVNTEIWTALMMTEYKQHGESSTFNKIVAAAQKAGASAGTLMGKFKAEFPKINPLVDKAAQALNREDFTTYEKAVQEMETRYKLGTKTINAMVNTAFNALQEKPATSTSTKSFAQELHADQGNYATVGENVAKDALAKALASGTEKQIKDAVAQAKKQGRTDNEIQTQVRQAYQKDFVDALVSGNKAKAQGIVKKILASGAYDEAGIAEKTLDWVKSENSSGLYESIKRGDSRQAAKVYSWMCQTYGSATMIKSISSWLDTNAADYEDNVRACLKAMGYGASSIENIIKKSYQKKNKTQKTQKTSKTSKTKTTKAWE